MASSRLRLLGFFLYVACLCTLPFSLLWGVWGLVMGGALTLMTVGYACWGRETAVLTSLGATRLSSDAQGLSHLTQELSHRMGIVPPTLWVIRSPALNSAVLGISRNKSALVFTSGALETLSREELVSLVARQLTTIVYGDSACLTWLTHTLRVLRKLGGNPKSRSRRENASLLSVLRRGLIYPLGLIPVSLLAHCHRPENLDALSAKVSRLPVALAATLRRLEAFRERLPLTIPWETHPLFLITPTSPGGMMEILLEGGRVLERIKVLEKAMVPR